MHNLSVAAASTAHEPRLGHWSSLRIFAGRFLEGARGFCAIFACAVPLPWKAALGTSLAQPYTWAAAWTAFGPGHWGLGLLEDLPAPTGFAALRWSAFFWWGSAWASSQATTSPRLRPFMDVRITSLEATVDDLRDEVADLKNEIRILKRLVVGEHNRVPDSETASQRSSRVSDSSFSVITRRTFNEDADLTAWKLLVRPTWLRARILSKLRLHALLRVGWSGRLSATRLRSTSSAAYEEIIVVSPAGTAFIYQAPAGLQGPPGLELSSCASVSQLDGLQRSCEKGWWSGLFGLHWTSVRTRGLSSCCSGRSWLASGPLKWRRKKHLPLRQRKSKTKCLLL